MKIKIKHSILGLILGLGALQAQEKGGPEGAHKKGMHYVGPGAAGYYNGGGIFGQYDYGVHQNWSIGVILGFNFTQKDVLNSATNGAGQVGYTAQDGTDKNFQYQNGPNSILFISVRADAHFGKWAKLPEEWDWYAGVQVGPNFYLDPHIAWVNAKMYLNNNAGVNNTERIIGKKQFDANAGVHSGVRYFCKDKNIGFQAEAVAGYNLLGVQLAAIWKLGQESSGDKKEKKEKVKVKKS